MRIWYMCLLHMYKWGIGNTLNCIKRSWGIQFAECVERMLNEITCAGICALCRICRVKCEINDGRSLMHIVLIGTDHFILVNFKWFSWLNREIWRCEIPWTVHICPNIFKLTNEQCSFFNLVATVAYTTYYLWTAVNRVTSIRSTSPNN